MNNFLKSHQVSIGFFLVTVFAAFRIVNYYNIFLNWNVYLWSDEAIYAMLSKRFLTGDFINAFNPYWNPGFSLATIPFYFITHSWEKAQILLSMSAGILLIYVMYFTLSRISFSLGITAAFLTAFSPVVANLILRGGWTEPLYVLFLWLAIFFGWQVIQTQKFYFYILTGIFFGLAYFTRTDIIYTLFAFLLFLFISLIFEKRKSLHNINLFNPITVSAVVLIILGYFKWILSSTNFLTKTSINYYPTASYFAFFYLLLAIGIFGLILHIKEKLDLRKVIKEIVPKIGVLVIAFFVINLPYIAAISINLGKFTISGKYAWIASGHPFTPEKDRLTTIAQDIWSIDYPNYQSPYYDSDRVYSKFLKNIDTAWEFFPKNFATLLGFYGFKNIFSLFETNLIIVGIIAGFLQKRLLKLTLYLFFLWLISLMNVTMFMGPYQRYLAFSYPFVISSHAIAIWTIGRFIKNFFEVANIKILSQFGQAFVLTAICLYYFNTHYNLADFIKGETVNRGQDQKLIGEYLKSKNIDVIMARTEGISLYSGAKLVYVPAAPPDVIVQFAKAWGVEYIVSRPEESSWPYMKMIVDPNFKHPDLELTHSFDDGTLLWKVILTEDEKKINYRTGKKIVIFCLEDPFAKPKDGLEPCPDRTY